MCIFLIFSLFRLSRWRLSVGSLGFYVLDSVLKLVAGVELLKEVFTSRARWMPLIVEWNASVNMFYLLKNIRLLILIIFKLKCNNLILNEIMILIASYVCLHVFSLRRESSDPDPERRIPHFWGGYVIMPKHKSKAGPRSFSHGLSGHYVRVVHGFGPLCIGGTWVWEFSRPARESLIS
jgi:hypothetical protein